MWPFRKKKDKPKCDCERCDANPEVADAEVHDLQKDLDEIVEIENSVFQDPWNRRQIEAVSRQEGALLIAKMNHRVVGYLCSVPHSRGARILTIVCDPEMRRRGIGRGLVQQLAAQIDKGESIVVAVSEADTDVHLFFRAIGFRATRVKRKYFTNTGRDAYVFTWRKRL